jgi:hypothetical protein
MRHLFDAPHMGFLVADCILELTTLYLHKQHTHTETYSQMEITYSIIFTNQILHIVFIILTSKPSYQLTIIQRITVI